MLRLLLLMIFASAIRAAINGCKHNPCRNGAGCFAVGNSINCVCRPGYTDIECETIIEEIDECSSNPCQNGGTCMDEYYMYRCYCRNGYIGPNCEEEGEEEEEEEEVYYAKRHTSSISIASINTTMTTYMYSYTSRIQQDGNYETTTVKFGNMATTYSISIFLFIVELGFILIISCRRFERNIEKLDCCFDEKHNIANVASSFSTVTSTENKDIKDPQPTDGIVSVAADCSGLSELTVLLYQRNRENEGGNSIQHRYEEDGNEILNWEKVFSFLAQNMPPRSSDNFFENLYGGYGQALLPEGTSVSNIIGHVNGGTEITTYLFNQFCRWKEVLGKEAKISHIKDTLKSMRYNQTLIRLENYLRQPVPQVETRTFAGITDNRNQKYDVYISHTEDLPFARYILLPYIEDECEMKTFFPDRDFAHEAGLPILHLYINATEQSRKIIVILSNGYQDDTMFNDLQLMTCILPLVMEKRMEEQDLLIVKLEKQIDLPVQVRHRPRIPVVDWTTTNDERHNLRKIKQWLCGDRLY